MKTRDPSILETPDEERRRLIRESVRDNFSRIVGEKALAESEVHIDLLHRVAAIRKVNAELDGRECDLSDLEPYLSELRRRAN
jgi:hypothetical protein